MQAAERSAWDALLDRSASGNSDASGAAAATSGSRLQQAVRQLILVSQQHGAPLSQRLLSRLLQAAAGGCGGEACRVLLVHVKKTLASAHYVHLS